MMGAAVVMLGCSVWLTSAYVYLVKRGIDRMAARSPDAAQLTDGEAR
jgi:hypothetical protein